MVSADSVRTTGCGRGGPKESVNGPARIVSIPHPCPPADQHTPGPGERTPPAPSNRSDLPESPSLFATIGRIGKGGAGGRPPLPGREGPRSCSASSLRPGGPARACSAAHRTAIPSRISPPFRRRTSRGSRSVASLSSADRFSGSGGTLIVVRGESGGGGGGGEARRGPVPVSGPTRHAPWDRWVRRSQDRSATPAARPHGADGGC